MNQNNFKLYYKVVNKNYKISIKNQQYLKIFLFNFNNKNNRIKN